MKFHLLIPKDITKNNFNVIRLILATSVVFSHCYVICYGWNRFVSVEPFMKWSGGEISIGSTAVNIFFSISGFLVYRSYERSKNFQDYLKKRISRIYPGFLVAFMLSFILFGPLGQRPFNVTNYLQFIHKVPMKRELANMVTLQSPNQYIYFTKLPQTGLNNSLWTIQYEFICYLLLLFVFLIKHRGRLILGIFLLCYILYQFQAIGLLFPFSKENDSILISNPYYYLRFFTYFLCGAIIYFFRKHIYTNSILVFVLLILLIFSFKYRFIPVVMPVILPYLIFYFAFHRYMPLFYKLKKIDLSYGVYLYGWPVSQLMMVYFGRNLNPISLFWGVIPITLFFALFSWIFVEQPALKWKSK